MKVLIAVMAVSLLFAATAHSGQEGFNFSRKPEIADIKPKKPVRIKLRRLSDGKYTWELSGDDIEELQKADRKLRKLFLQPEGGPRAPAILGPQAPVQ